MLGTVFKSPWYYLAHNRCSIQFFNMEGRKGERERGRKEGEETGREGRKEGGREGCGCYSDGPQCFSLSDFLRQEKTNVNSGRVDSIPSCPISVHPLHTPSMAFSSSYKYLRTPAFTETTLTPCQKANKPKNKGK